MHADSVAFAVLQSKALAEGIPTPPEPLDEHALHFWPVIYQSKRPTAWTPSDLVQACQLCREYSAINALSEDLARDGHVLEADNGRRYANPAARLLDGATRRAVILARALQIHAVATVGKTDDQGKKNAAAREMSAAIDTASDLIARPH